MKKIFLMGKKVNTLRGKLFAYMLFLAVILTLCGFAAMFTLGQFDDVKEHYGQTLDMQLAVFEKEVTDHYENAVLSAAQLSGVASQKMENALNTKGIPFNKLKNDRDTLVSLQDELFEPLKNSMLQANMSGAFVIWDTTINSDATGARDNRNGLYIQLVKRSTEESTVIVYRGHADVGRAHGAMPHRKWRVEFDVSAIPNFSELMAKASRPIEEARSIIPVSHLPGTTEKVMLVTVPIIGSDDVVYGLCGFELAQMHFKEVFSQPTTLGRLTCMFIPQTGNRIDSGKALSCGVRNGYYYAPTESLAISEFGKKLLRMSGEDNEYVAVTKTKAFTKGGAESLLAVMIPKEEYDYAIFLSNVKMVIIILLLTFFAVVVCLIFSSRFISPITKGLGQLKTSAESKAANEPESERETGYREIDELVAFVKDKMTSKADDVVMPQYMEKMFNRFIDLTGELTPSELNALSLLIQGHDVKELPNLLFVSESTAKHHVLKIYKKLGVSSRGELLLYIEMLKGCGLIDKIGASF